MTKVYACLAGNWVCLNDDPKCTIGEQNQSPYCWWEEGASIYAPINRSHDMQNSMYHLNYVHIFYHEKDWRINPMFIQIVNE